MGEVTNSEEALRKRREEFREFRAQQKRAELAAALLRSRSDHDPFLHGYPGEPLVQRIGVFILGAFFASGGAAMLDIMVRGHSRVGVIVSVLFSMAGVGAIIGSFTGRKAKPSR